MVETAHTHVITEHFQLYFYSMLAQMLRNLQDAQGTAQLDGLVVRFPFLKGYQQIITSLEPAGLPREHAQKWWEQSITSWETRHPEHLPLRALVRMIGVQAVRALLAAGMVEEDLRFGALFAALQDPVQSTRPSMGLLGWLLGDPNIWQSSRALISYQLVQVENPNDSRAEWALRSNPLYWDALHGRPLDDTASKIVHQSRTIFPNLDALILPQVLAEQVTRLPDLLRTRQLNTLVIRGMKGTGRRSIIGAVARALERDVLLYEGTVDESRRLLGPLATLIGAIPILRCDPGPGETVELDTLPLYGGTVGVTMGRSGGLRGKLMENALSLQLPPPDAEARRRFWVASGMPITTVDLDDIAARFLLTGGVIERAARLGYTYTTLDMRRSLTADDVQKALRAINRQTLDTLASHLEAVSGWDDLVVSDEIRRELLAFETRSRNRERLREEAGAAFTRNLNRGVRALFSGPSGTGKTLAARALAAVLQMDLYRVDLAAVVNKYIGETERNLNEVFARAEELDVILLLDEGDSLMTKRTDVSNANDRYANLETNYLLQRLETYEGIVIITTNAAQRIDSAFLRRLDVVVEFGKPKPEERRRLWQLHLPARHDISPGFMDMVVMRCGLTGGQIRNSALFATLLGVEQDQPIDDTMLAAALEREYRTAGISFPLRKTDSDQDQPNRLQRFADALR
ncbi:MAG: ATP-binding protein [Anaerolineae bacterium]